MIPNLNVLFSVTESYQTLPLISGTSNKHKISVSPLYSSLSTLSIILNNVILLKVHLRSAYLADNIVNKGKN